MSSPDNLKREAKRWLKAIRGGDPDARARFTRACPEAAAEPTLRDVQHALAREHGFDGWNALRAALDRGRSDDETFVSLLRTASGSRAAWQREFDRILRRHPNAVRAGYRWGDAIVIAAAHAPAYVIEALVRHGAAVDIAGKSSMVPEEWRGLMPLHSAALHGNGDAVRVLLHYGADTSARDAVHTRTPADWAADAGHESIRDMLLEAARETLAWRREVNNSNDPASLFLLSACWDHHVHGRGDHLMYDRAAQRLLAAHPEIATGSLFAAIVCGEIAEVRRALQARPQAAREPGGVRRWTPLLYLCYTRFTHAPTLANAGAIARLLLDHGADANDFYMAGDSQYTALVGAAGEGEQGSPRQPWAAAVYALLLDRGAGPYDIQVLYNTHFSTDMIWWLDLTYRHTVAGGMKADWDDPAWSMLDMGGYGPGSYFVLDHAIRKNNVDLVEWALAHGADPNIMSSDHQRFRPKRSLLEQARLHGRTAIADLLRRRGARAAGPDELAPWEAVVDACVRLDRATLAPLVERYPQLKSPAALFEAARLDRADVLALLADLGYSLDAADAHNTRALHHAAGANALRAAQFLLDAGVDANARETNWGATPIGWAAHSGHADMIDLLSRYSRDIRALALRGYVDRVRELLEDEPALARQTDPDGVTPLWWLPDDDGKAMAIVELLLAAGADRGARNTSGRTAADWARRRGMLDVARLLEEQARS